MVLQFEAQKKNRFEHVLVFSFDRDSKRNFFYFNKGRTKENLDPVSPVWLA
jgi:hypothetical protein